PVLTPAYQRWIEASPFMAMATVGGGDAATVVAPGGLDCSPRGDRPGHLFTVLDERTIAIPDRRGNNRLDTLRNLIADPRIALLFLVPGVPECVRINGTAAITTDPDLRQRFGVDGHEPTTVILVSIDSVYFQCARAIIRSKLWEPETRADPASLPTAGEMTRSGDTTFDAQAYDAILRERQRATLY
ncbi:MAG: pyridoxamine 5'-phosphate oxidase family protein, partial [Hyphomicrobiaceae bacterium]|nr:pyridoxamine 5'-phosphate oxidase family protein [Hyphomicrobiaceae bacterium]